MKIGVNKHIDHSVRTKVTKLTTGGGGGESIFSFKKKSVFTE